MGVSDSYRTLHVNYVRTDKKKYYWLNQIVAHWNGLHGAIVSAGNPVVFFKRLERKVNFIVRRSIYCA